MNANGREIANTRRRNAIFSSIRRSLAASKPYDADWRKHHELSSRDPRGLGATQPGFLREELIENFCKSLEFVTAHSYVVSSEFGATGRISDIIEKTGAKRIAVSDSPLVEKLLPKDVGAEFFQYTETSELFESDLGITSAQWAIAETGTLVLEASRERHRLTSLVPPVHLCVLHADSIRQTLGEILELINRDRSRLVTFITGSSRTSDIELTLAVGVHGPEELHVIIIVD